MTIGCLAIGPLEPDLPNPAMAALGEQFESDVVMLDAIAVPEGIYDPKRNQHNSELLLRYLLAHRPDGVDKLLGMTNIDLFIPMLSFVFGQAQLNGGMAVVSTARLRQEFYHLPPLPTLTMQRLAKEAVHEIGHAFGLTHCVNRGCAMSLSTSLQNLDRKDAALCADCRVLLVNRSSSISHHLP